MSIGFILLRLTSLLQQGSVLGDVATEDTLLQCYARIVVSCKLLYARARLRLREVSPEHIPNLIPDLMNLGGDDGHWFGASGVLSADVNRPVIIDVRTVRKCDCR